MSWDFNQNDQGWLNKCAIGVLKEFVELSRVNNRLDALGKIFSSTYVGDKCVLWSFDSVSQRDVFIKNRGLWDDSFSAMVKWTDAAVPKSRLVWINVWGVPMSC